MKKLLFVLFLAMAGVFSCEKQPENGTAPNVDMGVKPMGVKPAYFDYHCERCGFGCCVPIDGGTMYYNCPSCGCNVCMLGSTHPCLVERLVAECP